MADRVRDLDGLHGPYGDPTDEVDTDSDVATVLHVMQRCTPGRPSPVGRDARLLDELVSRCQVVRRLAERYPRMVLGPVDHSRQYWLGTSRGRAASADEPQPAAGAFVAPTGVARHSTKPSRGGLFTSTSYGRSYGMWHSYVALDTSDLLYPRPWSIWHVDVAPGATVFELTDATSWVELLKAFPQVEDGLVHPDWSAIGDRFDGVHMSLRAVIATQGVRVALDADQIAAAPFWDVESTLWLRWAFSGARRVRSVL